MLFWRFLAERPQTAAFCADTISGYAHAELPRALSLDAPLPCMPAAPPLGTGSRSAWTAQAHSVAGPLGLLCTALSEFRAATRPNFACVAHPHIIFHATRLPHQHVHKHVDILAYEVLAATHQRTRTDYAELRSLTGTCIILLPANSLPKSEGWSLLRRT